MRAPALTIFAFDEPEFLNSALRRALSNRQAGEPFGNPWPSAALFKRTAHAAAEYDNQADFGSGSRSSIFHNIYFLGEFFAAQKLNACSIGVLGTMQAARALNNCS